MLRINEISSPAKAASYYRSADYYVDGESMPAFWHGKAAERLGLSGEVRFDDFSSLCNNRDPSTGERLTAAKGKRRVGYDFTFSVPKSVSLAYSLGQDEEVADALRGAVGDTMAEVERELSARVRKGGQNVDRTTGNMAWVDFLHTTSRPVGRMPDPHLHVHAVAMSLTFDEGEGEWKAGQFGDLKRNAPYFQAAFRAHLANRLQDLGYAIERSRDDFEIAGAPRHAIAEFSRRTSLIEAMAERLGIVSAEAKSKLGATTREVKRGELSKSELVEAWGSRLTSDEIQGIRTARGEPVRRESRTSEAVTSALSHLLERSATAEERQVATEALKFGLGAVEPEAIWKELNGRDLIRGEIKGLNLVSTQQVADEERRIVAFATNGIGACRPLGRMGADVPEFLTPTQAAAVEHAWRSTDRVTLIRGVAGSGKTTLLRSLLEQSSVPSVVLAPSAEASRGVLRRDGFAEAETLAKFLQSEEMQQRAANGLIVLDEASLAGSRDIAKLFQTAEEIDSRLLLLGDRRQHKSVSRGDVLKLLEDHARLSIAEVSEIKRQTGKYRNAVAAASQGDVAEAFRQLDKLGWVKEGRQSLVDDYMQAKKDGKSVLVVSPTHAEGNAIASAIRERLKAEGEITGPDRECYQLLPIRFTEAERGRAEFLEDGMIAQFHKAGAGYRAGSRVIVTPENRDRLAQAAERLSMYREAAVPLAKGDEIRITGNGWSEDEHRLNNGAVYKVGGFAANGGIKLDNGWTLAPDFGHLASGVVTSHASQGRTVDRVLISQSSESFPASGKEQFYASISRGREGATVYTDDKKKLRAAIAHSDDRVLATDLMKSRKRSIRSRIDKHIAFMRDAAARTIEAAKETLYASRPDYRAAER